MRRPRIPPLARYLLAIDLSVKANPDNPATGNEHVLRRSLDLCRHGAVVHHRHDGALQDVRHYLGNRVLIVVPGANIRLARAVVDRRDNGFHVAVDDVELGRVGGIPFLVAACEIGAFRLLRRFAPRLFPFFGQPNALKPLLAQRFKVGSGVCLFRRHATYSISAARTVGRSEKCGTGNLSRFQPFDLAVM